MKEEGWTEANLFPTDERPLCYDGVILRLKSTPGYLKCSFASLRLTIITLVVLAQGLPFSSHPTIHPGPYADPKRFKSRAILLVGAGDRTAFCSVTDTSCFRAHPLGRSADGGTDRLFFIPQPSGPSGSIFSALFLFLISAVGWAGTDDCSILSISDRSDGFQLLLILVAAVFFKPEQVVWLQYLCYFQNMVPFIPVILMRFGN